MRIHGIHTRWNSVGILIPQLWFQNLVGHSRSHAHGYELILQGMRDGWIMDQDDEPLFWVPVEQREHLYVPPFRGD